ncbi:MAG: tRNA guanosine(34) transglycosylase Tgt [Solirubrobacterales bacterium]
MRVESDRLRFEIGARDGAARAGVIHTAHGRIETPAFIPLATKGTVRGLESREVAELGYQLILGNTYHLFVSPGPERIAAAGGLHRFMGWERALITDSGGFQVFSLAHGGVANEVKGSGRSGGEHGSTVDIGEEGARFRSYRDGSELFISPEVSMRVQAALGSDIALVFDECTPFHADREYTARSTERTHRWLGRCLEWHQREGPERQAVFGIVQGGVHEDLRRESAAAVAAAGVDGIAIGGTLGRDKEEMHAVLAMTAPLLPDEAPKHLLGIGEVDDLLGGIALGLDVFDCAVPTRLARHGVALAPDPENRFRLDLRKSRWVGDRRPLVEGCPCPACQRHDRDYVSYLSRAEELTAVRLIVLHNLTYMHQLTIKARAAIEAGSFTAYRAAALAGKSPWDAAIQCSF